jgi:hypothetical protein
MRLTIMTTVDITVMNAIMRYRMEYGHYPSRFEVAHHFLEEMTQREFTFQVPQGIPCLLPDLETQAPKVIMRKCQTVTVPIIPVVEG